VGWLGVDELTNPFAQGIALEAAGIDAMAKCGNPF